MSNLDDHEAWADFVARYAEPIHRIARAKGLSRTDAEDLVQQVLIRVARAMPSYRRVERAGAFRRWLGTLSRWCVTDQWRSAKREEAKRVRLEQVTETTVNPVLGIPQWATSWLEASVGDLDLELCDLALSRLQRRFSDRDIQIFMQIALQGWDPATVAWFHSTSRTAVYLVKFRMLAPFRREVRSLQKGYDSGREKSAKDSPTA